MIDSDVIQDLEWKKELRSSLIMSLIGDECEKKQAYSKLEYFYTCCAPTFLYKYYSDQKRTLDTIRNQKIWCSAPCKFNDAFDCDVSMNEEEFLNVMLRHLYPDRKILIGSPVWRMAKTETEQGLQEVRKIFENMKADIGISCFSEVNNSLLMWAHYANNHQGICAEYELLEINKRSNHTPIPVIYSNQRAALKFKMPFAQKEATRIFFESVTSKSIEWNYEKEWRIIHTALKDQTRKEKNGVLINMIYPSSIILGCEVRDDFEKDVYSLCEDLKINLYKMEKDLIEYKLNKKLILNFS